MEGTCTACNAEAVELNEEMKCTHCTTPASAEEVAPEAAPEVVEEATPEASDETVA